MKAACDFCEVVHDELSYDWNKVNIGLARYRLCDHCKDKLVQYVNKIMEEHKDGLV